MTKDRELWTESRPPIRRRLDVRSESQESVTALSELRCAFTHVLPSEAATNGEEEEGEHADPK